MTQLRRARVAAASARSLGPLLLALSLPWLCLLGARGALAAPPAAGAGRQHPVDLLTSRRQAQGDRPRQRMCDDPHRAFA